MIATPVSGAFLDGFRAAADGGDTLRFDRFVELALYHPELGYYRRAARRIGRTPDADFYTASETAAFGELVAAAAVGLVGEPDAGACAFVEIGAERPGGVLAGVRHPFAEVRTVRIGETPALAGRCVVFSNELFDAQPFRRFVFRRGGWRELGVRALAGARLAEVEVESDVPACLPPQRPEGYRIDAPFAAAALAGRIASAEWTGLFLAFDYGKSWEELAGHTPAGTARAYRAQRQSEDLLASPGEQDLTCHVCWDWIEDALRRRRFDVPVVEPQEAFFVKHAAARLERIMAEDAGRFTPRKQSVQHLLHPAHMGRKFQALYALR